MRIFISYAREEQSIIKELSERLRAAEFDVWFDERLLPGQNWEQVLYDEIRTADAFIFAISPASIASEWCEREYDFAVEMDKPIFPVLLKPTSSIPRKIGAIQYANFTKGITEPQLTKLVRVLASVRLDEEGHLVRIPTNIKTYYKRGWISGKNVATAQFDLDNHHIVEFHYYGTGLFWKLAVRVDGEIICKKTTPALGTWKYGFEIDGQDCVSEYAMFSVGLRLDFLVNGYRVGWSFD